MLTKLTVDYSMLSKTNVHHFAGNNVSHSREFPHLHSEDYAPCCTPDLDAGGLPYEEILLQELGGSIYVLTILLRLNWALHAESSITVRRWRCWMLVTRIS